MTSLKNSNHSLEMMICKLLLLLWRLPLPGSQLLTLPPMRSKNSFLEPQFLQRATLFRVNIYSWMNFLVSSKKVPKSVLSKIKHLLNFMDMWALELRPRQKLLLELLASTRINQRRTISSMIWIRRSLRLAMKWRAVFALVNLVNFRTYPA